MISVIIAFLLGAAVLYFYFSFYPSSISADDAIERVRDRTELVKKIPELLKQQKIQFLVVADHTSQNIRGIVTEEKYVTDKNNNTKRTRLLVSPLNGSGETAEWMDYIDPVSRKSYNICVGSGTALVTLARKPNTDDDPRNINWNALPNEYADRLKREADNANAYQRQAHSYRQKYENVANQLSLLRADLAEKEETIRAITIKYDTERQTVANLMEQRNRLSDEIRQIRNKLKIYETAIEQLSGLLNIPAHRLVEGGLPVDEATRNKYQQAGEILKEKEKAQKRVEEQVGAVAPQPSAAEKEEEQAGE